MLTAPSHRPIQRVLIANRGEIAVRIAHTVAAMGKRWVAIYSDADRMAWHTRHAEHAIRVGGAPAQDSYLNIDAIIAAAKQSKADAIHPGYGFLAENAEFAERCHENNMVFIGPPPKAMRTMGNKTQAREAMLAAGVPVVPGSDGPLSDDAAPRLAQAMGYPVMLKASAGGGGKGMRLVAAPKELAMALRAARSEAKSAFGDDTIYMEKALIRPKHIEVQIFAEADGRVLALGERDCSMQRRHQKVIEEAPSSTMTQSLRRAMGEVACQAARAVDYRGAGTIEFLLDSCGQFFFLEMNTRLQVEHAITECVYGLDLVMAQILVAEGLSMWPTDAPNNTSLAPRCHAIEARLYAEDPDNKFMPQPGCVTDVSWACGPGVRIDAGVGPKSHVSGFYDPMVAKIIAYAPTRDMARRRLLNALAKSHVGGVITNKVFLQTLLNSQAFIDASYHTQTISDGDFGAPKDNGASATEAHERHVAHLALIVAGHLKQQKQTAPSANALSPAASTWSQPPWQYGF